MSETLQDLRVGGQSNILRCQRGVAELCGECGEERKEGVVEEARKRMGLRLAAGSC